MGKSLSAGRLTGYSDRSEESPPFSQILDEMGKQLEEGFFPKIYGDRFSKQTGTDHVLYAALALDRVARHATAEERRLIATMIGKMVEFWIRRDYRYTDFNKASQRALEGRRFAHRRRSPGLQFAPTCRFRPNGPTVPLKPALEMTGVEAASDGFAIVALIKSSRTKARTSPHKKLPASTRVSSQKVCRAVSRQGEGMSAIAVDGFAISTLP